MEHFGRFYLDKEKDLTVDLFREGEEISYVLRTPNHGTANLISNLARLCRLPLDQDENGMKVIRGTLPCYIDGKNRMLYVFRLLDTKIANVYPDGTIERKASIPAIAKTLMSQTKDYRLDFRKTVVKTYIFRECKFRTDLHTHMNANLEPDLLIALGIHHQIRYPLYYIRKLGLKCTPAQEELLARRREKAAEAFRDSPLRGKYLDRKINDATFLNFASLILENPENAAWNLPRIRASLAVMKDGQAVFTNLEKVYLYRYVFCKGIAAEDPIPLEGTERIPDADIVRWLGRMAEDRKHPVYARNTLFQDKLLWIARSYARCGIDYAEISDTTLAKPGEAPRLLKQIHEVLPTVREETGVTLRFLAAIRRTPLTILKDRIAVDDAFHENLRALRAVAGDPYVAGSDIVGEEINDIRDLSPLLREIVRLTAEHSDFTIRIHAGENDGLPENVANALRCVREGLAPGQPMPRIRIGHGLYTTSLSSRKGQSLLRELKDAGVVLEFQITSNVRLNNLDSVTRHPLRQYLAAGVDCVQGTDGAALYGTDSIDEELALEKMLNLTREELLAMRAAEDRVREAGLRSFGEKDAAFREALAASGETDTERFYELRMQEQACSGETLLELPELLDTGAALREQIRELPLDRVPVILIGGSFNNDRHLTRLRSEICRMLDRLLEEGDPEKMFLVIGHSLSGYERYIARKNQGKFDLFAFAPARVTPAEAEHLRKSGAGIRPSIEPSPMGVYKSFAYEIFKRRPSVLIALDGNSAGANMIQEAKNGKRKCHIFVFDRARMLREKAMSLQGYATLFDERTELAELVARAVETSYPEKWLRKE